MLVRILFLLVIIILASLRASEGFAAQKTTVFTSMSVNHTEWLPSNYTIKTISYDNWDIFLRLVKRNEVKRIADGRVYVVADGYDANTVFKGKKSVGVSKTGYFVAIMEPVRAFSTECSYNIFNKTVGFFDISDAYFIKALAIGHRIPLENVELQKLDYNTDLLKAFRDIDVVITYVIPDSPFFRWLQVQPVSIMGFANIDIDRIKLSYPYVSDSKRKLKDIFYTTAGTRAMILARENDALVPSMQMQLLDISPASYSERFIDSLEITQDAIDPDYKCYGDRNIDTKPLCNSDYDVMGLPKKTATVWDRPCQKDEDCPFFRANKKYKNNRGKCLKDGLCELPIGVQRRGFTLYTGTPFCYNCRDPLNPLCCDITGDYAFKDDYAERKQNGLETSIIKL